MRRDHTFEQHAAQITYYINEWHNTDPEDTMAITEGFILYVVAQCVPKMWRRISPSPRRTPPPPKYFQQIVDLSADRLGYFPSESFNKFDTTFLKAFHGHRGRQIRKIITEDISLRRSNLYSSDDFCKSRILDTICERGILTADDLFLNILKLNPATPQTIYTPETYQEIHELLRFLLLGYRDSVGRLYTLKKNQTHPPSSAILFSCIDAVCDYLSILHPLAYLKAMASHLLNAASLIMTLVLQIPSDNPDPITVKILSIPRVRNDMKPWEGVVRDVIGHVGLVRNGLLPETLEISRHDLDAKLALEAINEMMGRHSDFDNAMKKVSSGKFRGRIHCEAFIASVMAKQANGDGNVRDFYLFRYFPSNMILPYSHQARV